MKRASIQLLLHPRPPSPAKPPHRPDHATAHHSNGAHSRKQPAIADDSNQGAGGDGGDAGEGVADEIVGCNAGGGLAGHEFGEHCGSHAENEHAADAEEKVGDELGW